jgi:hypothetical protein
MINGNPYVIAITNRDRSYYSLTSCPLAEKSVCYVNFGRWIDSGVYSFITEYSNF